MNQFSLFLLVILKVVILLPDAQTYRNAIAAVKAGTATSDQIRLTEKMAQQTSFLGSSPLTGDAREALKSLGKKKQ